MVSARASLVRYCQFLFSVVAWMEMLLIADIPILPQVEAACELLGLDPLYVANEGKLIAICAPEVADLLLSAMRSHPLGHAAQRIGTVIEDSNGFVQMATRFGGRRVLI